MSNIRFPFWQEVRKLLVDRQDGTYAERVEAYPPIKLMTDDDGEYSRLRVDVGQTGFFKGTEFFTFYEFSIPQGQTYTIKASTAVDVFLQKFLIDCWTGSLRVEWYAGGTQVNPFLISVPVFRTNNTASADLTYQTQVVMQANGTHTGGTLVDVLQLNAGNKDNAVEGGSADPIGFPIGDYYIKIINKSNQTTTGTFKARWEERP
jgi:hypothetical protein